MLRTLTRCSNLSEQMSADRFGPNALALTPLGSGALVERLQQRHFARSRRYSTTVTANCGSSATWCTSGSTDSSTPPHQHRSADNSSSNASSTRSGSNATR